MRQPINLPVFSSVEFIASKCTRSCVKHTSLNDVSAMPISVAISDLLARGPLSHITRHITCQITRHILRQIARQMTREVTSHITCQITRHIARHITHQIIIICHGPLGAPYALDFFRWIFFSPTLLSAPVSLRMVLHRFILPLSELLDRCHITSTLYRPDTPLTSKTHGWGQYRWCPS